jgi:hypothetical protein
MGSSSKVLVHVLGDGSQIVKKVFEVWESMVDGREILITIIFINGELSSSVEHTDGDFRQDGGICHHCMCTHTYCMCEEVLKKLLPPQEPCVYQADGECTGPGIHPWWGGLVCEGCVGCD